MVVIIFRNMAPEKRLTKKIKVLFFIESLEAGGKERRLVELLRNLSKNEKYEIELVLTKSEIHYKEVNSFTIKIHILERKYLKKDPRLFFQFYRICKKFSPDIIHVWGQMVAIYAIPSKILFRIPMINSQITGVPRKLDRGILSHKIPFLFSDMIVANTNAGLARYNAPKQKGKVINNGFDFSRINKVDNSFCLCINSSTNLIITMISTFSDYKDYDTYLRSAVDVLNINSNITFLCVGDGNADRYKSSIPSIYRKNIIFLGKRSDIENIINISTIGVLSSFQEGLPNSLLEFMAFGKPVVASDVGGVRELVIDGKTGFLFPARNDKELTNRILALVNNESLRENMGKSGYERVKSFFGIDKMLNAFDKLYEEVMHI